MKLREMFFTVFTQDNTDKDSKSNEANKHFPGTNIWAFQLIMELQDGIAIMI